VEFPPPFSPNLTMNLTYLCYGPSKVRQQLVTKQSFRLMPVKIG
jgi:hypothetical protein